ncbi:integral membrane protein GPR137C isoform X2 [Dendropsophus ebraccatus]|uniref:integral membrane protein GPR137C isoform X2 n=1 Tax=Dendropsophus ebraccatus TaxID=150705 RepID=UPI003831446E
MTAAIPWALELGLTVLCTVLCSLLFLLVYVQLWLLLHYKQKRLSYQSLLLFLCLLWAGFRTVLFSFYLTNCAQANGLQPFPHWLLYCSPICLQFFTLCLLNLYFSQVIFKARCSPEFNRYKIPLHFGFLLTSLAFLIVNLSCILLGDGADEQHGWITMIRLIFSDCLFAACSISLANNAYRIANMSPAYVYLESKAVTEETDSLEYLIFGIILLICEFLPMSLMVYFFRAKKLSQNLEPAGMVNSHSFGSRAYFFDNPRRYDSDDDLPRLAGARAERGSLSSTPKSSGWYGAICPTSSCALAPPLLSEPASGTPILFTCGGNTLA